MSLKSFFLILFVTLLIVAFIFFFNMKENLDLNIVLNYYDQVNNYIESNFVKSVLIFILSYAILVILNFPLVSLLSLSGGLFFGTVVGGLIVTIGATLGSLIFFVFAKYFFYDFFKTKVLHHLSKFENFFKKNEFNFLFILRLFPGIPFVIQTLIASSLGANNMKFLLATFLGIMPITFIITNIGSNIHQILASGEEFGFHLIYQPQYIIPIITLLSLSIIGFFLKNKLN